MPKQREENALAIIVTVFIFLMLFAFLYTAMMDISFMAFLTKYKWHYFGVLAIVAFLTQIFDMKM